MIFAPAMVHKVVNGVKTQTRRLVEPDKPCRYEVGKDYAVQPGRGKEAVARIRIKSVRKEKLGAMKPHEAVKEGFRSWGGDSAVLRFVDYWTKLQGKWDRDQEVWVLDFVLMEPTNPMQAKESK